jgi:simple sugar transport system ATP-binding protein
VQAQSLSTTAPALDMRGVVKRFGETVVLDAVDFDLRRGEVHALLGENGAGKSTLMNLLAGIYAADAGTVRVNGAEVALRGPAAAAALGIGMVHQHFRLAAPFTGRENIRLAAGVLPALRARDAVDRRIAQVLADTALAEVGRPMPLDTPVGGLAVADRQRIEILKALVLGARILVLDEPTAVLTDAEAEGLLALVRRLAAADHAVVLITHKLREVMAAGDRVSVLRRGRMVLAGVQAAQVTPDALSAAMIGTTQSPAQPAAARTPGPSLLTIAGLDVAGDAGGEAVRGIDLTIRAGQIAGIAGVGGNGQSELAEVLIGLRAATAGSIRLAGEALTQAGIAARRDAGLRYIPSDRSEWALAPNATLDDNLSADAIRRGALGRWLISSRRIHAHGERLTRLFGIAGAAAGGRRPVRLLSGGNAQKVVLARELDEGARLIVAHSPTRGLDVAACAYVHERLTAAAARGAGVLLISEDLEEILALSDTIAVMSRGRLATTPGARPDRTQIGALMLGHA